MSKLDDLLKYDSLAEAAKITGKSYKTDTPTSTLGLMLLQDNNIKKDNMLKTNGDVYYSISLQNYIKVIEQYGFQLVYSEDFKSNREWDNDTLYIYYHWRFGILLVFDSYGGNEQINGSRFYYNFGIPHNDDNWLDLVSSGAAYNPKELTQFAHIWSGYHDGREAVIHNIENIIQKTTFIQPWKYFPNVWLHHYMDDPDRSNKKLLWEEKLSILHQIQKNRIKKLPKEIHKNCLFDHLLMFGSNNCD